METDKRVLELGRGFALDGLAIAVDAIDVATTDILLGIGRSHVGQGAAIDLLADLAVAFLRIVQALVAQEGALAVILDIGAVAGGGLGIAGRLTPPRPAALGDGHALDHASFFRLGAGLLHGRAAAAIQRIAAALLTADGDRVFAFLLIPKGAGLVILVVADRAAAQLGRARVKRCGRRDVALTETPVPLDVRAAGTQFDLRVAAVHGRADGLADSGRHLALQRGFGSEARHIGRAPIEVAGVIDDLGDHAGGAGLQAFLDFCARIARRLVIALLASRGREGFAFARRTAELFAIQEAVRVLLDLGRALGRRQDLRIGEAGPGALAIGDGAKDIVPSGLRSTFARQLVRIAEIGPLGQARALIARHHVDLRLAWHQ